MESFPDMTINGTKVVQATGIEDPGRVSGAGRRRSDPEVPGRARRRTFTAKYKLEVFAAYDAAPDGEKGAVRAIPSPADVRSRDVTGSPLGDRPPFIHHLFARSLAGAELLNNYDNRDLHFWVF